MVVYSNLLSHFFFPPEAPAFELILRDRDFLGDREPGVKVGEEKREKIKEQNVRYTLFSGNSSFNMLSIFASTDASVTFLGVFGVMVGLLPVTLLDARIGRRVFFPVNTIAFSSANSFCKF